MFYTVQPEAHPGDLAVFNASIAANNSCRDSGAASESRSSLESRAWMKENCKKDPTGVRSYSSERVEAPKVLLPNLAGFSNRRSGSHGDGRQENRSSSPEDVGQFPTENNGKNR
ncbi:hypothetical protein NDU88_005488 [Pleurodeles waltl]|uniref:Uncharacterized protein n=1 Tax=Pleurodeles waltl TaxID=8319 RepID=A0AAV7MWH6_PLEWA|nr:hypothetical protein NDU88_005488 [Pleurodeles waltl]